jgi:hypothetical protein
MKEIQMAKEAEERAKNVKVQKKKELNPNSFLQDADIINTNP